MSESANDVPHLDTPSPLAIATAFGLIYLSWGTTYFATGFAMQELQMPPALFGGVRLLLAGVILLTWQACRGRSLRITAGDFLRLIPIAVFLFLFGNWFINLGQRNIESGVAAILIATTPLWIGLFGMFWPRGERLHWLGWLGLVVGFGGIVVTMAPRVQDGFSFAANYHSLFVLGSAASWAVGSLLSRHLHVQLPHLTSAGYQMILGGLCQTVLGSALGEWPDLVAKIETYALVTFVYLLIVGSLTGFVAFNWLLGHVSAAKVGTYAYVNPVIAVFIGWIMGETAVHAPLLAGIAIVLVGVYLVRSDHVPSQEIELEPD
jgi:drug/metabolite transporter (DMT)-like permease